MKTRRMLVLTAIAVISAMLVGCGNTKSSGTSTSITEEEAKTIALEDAQLKESEVTSLTVKSAIDDGVEEYEVNFYVDVTEYDYDIDASTGKIRSKDKDIDDDLLKNKNSTNTEVPVSEQDAIATALAKVPGSTDADIRINLDRDNGRQVYEGSILFENKEYDFEINAETGEVIEWSEESALED